MPHRDLLVERAQTLLRTVQGRELALEELAHTALELAPIVHALCEIETRPRDREQAHVLSRMMTDKRGQVFTTLLTDRAYRSVSKKRTVEQARYLLEKVGQPEYVGALDQVGLGALRKVGDWLPTLTGTAMLNRIRTESSAFILPAGHELDVYLQRCKSEGVDVNINHLGEEVLGEREAEARVQGYIQLLARPGVNTLSVKISSIASQIDSLAFDASIATLRDRLKRIYQASLVHVRADGSPKRVVLDMEAFRDVELTLAAFQQTLDLPELLQVHAGIALQTYLPETSRDVAAVLEWAKRRVAQGGAPIRIRLVKGANLATERVESAIQGWQVPIYPSKSLVDANLKRVLLQACQAENAAVAHIGLASHNLFDVCFGLVLRSSRQLGGHLSFELLHGMAEPLRRALQRLGASVLLYAPIVGDHEFPSAIAYLVRRLDENTSPENYLRHSFSMRVSTPTWKDQEQRFLAACRLAAREEQTLRPRAVDRNQEQAPLRFGAFVNEPDTDFARPQNRTWIAGQLAAFRQRSDSGSIRVTSRIAGDVVTGHQMEAGFDPSRPDVVPYEVNLADPSAIDIALDTATRAGRDGASPEQRSEWLSKASRALRQARGELIAAMVLDAGKRVIEADVEVSEAIDFAEYYRQSYQQLDWEAMRNSVTLSAHGPVVIAPPWNFPLAIPLGGVFAALVAGNPVLLKPALETPLVAQVACELLWAAGIPQAWLQLVVCRDEVGSQLITDARTKAVVLTGATSTARRFLEMRPRLRLFAETGGKNALYVSEMSDHEQAVGDIVRSAFGHAGQKCSALSQLILHAELYDSEGFLRVLQDATESLKVGSAWDLDSKVTPLIAPPSELQRQACTTLLPGEAWLVKPRFDEHNPRLVSPGIKLGVRAGSATHTTEFFCPLLAVLRATDVGEAVRIANSTDYGLTAGLHSLDEREHDYFIEHIQAGNVYINRPITGAIVQRQPFGGWKSSGFGAGSKAGGPNYVAQFVQPDVKGSAEDYQEVEEGPLPRRVERVLQKLTSLFDDSALARLRTLANVYLRTHTEWFAGAFDPSHVRGEDNLLRYRPVRVLVVVDDSLEEVDVASLALGCAVTECRLEVVRLNTGAAHAPLPAGSSVAEALRAETIESDAALCQRLSVTKAERVRAPAAAVSEAAQAILNARNIPLWPATPLALPRQELLCFLREQAVSVRYHRYGHLGLRDLHSTDASA